MSVLTDIAKRNAGISPLFSVVLDVDFYDGPTEAICKLIHTERWFLCSLVNIDFEAGVRIFTMLEAEKVWLSEVKPKVEKFKNGNLDFYDYVKEKIRLFFDGYTGEVHLYRSDWLSSKDYRIVQIPLGELKYFKNIEDVIDQDNDAKLKWDRHFK